MISQTSPQFVDCASTTSRTTRAAQTSDPGLPEISYSIIPRMPMPLIGTNTGFSLSVTITAVIESYKTTVIIAAPTCVLSTLTIKDQYDLDLIKGCTAFIGDIHINFTPTAASDALTIPTGFASLGGNLQISDPTLLPSASAYSIDFTSLEVITKSFIILDSIINFIDMPNIGAITTIDWRNAIYLNKIFQGSIMCDSVFINNTGLSLLDASPLQYSNPLGEFTFITTKSSGTAVQLPAAGLTFVDAPDPVIFISDRAQAIKFKSIKGILSLTRLAILTSFYYDEIDPYIDCGIYLSNTYIEHFESLVYGTEVDGDVPEMANLEVTDNPILKSINFPYLQVPNLLLSGNSVLENVQLPLAYQNNITRNGTSTFEAYTFGPNAGDFFDGNNLTIVNNTGLTTFNFGNHVGGIIRYLNVSGNGNFDLSAALGLPDNKTWFVSHDFHYEGSGTLCDYVQQAKYDHQNNKFTMSHNESFDNHINIGGTILCKQTNSTPPDNTPVKLRANHIGAIVGGSAACAVFLMVILILALWRRRGRGSRKTIHPEMMPAAELSGNDVEHKELYGSGCYVNNRFAAELNAQPPVAEMAEQVRPVELEAGHDRDHEGLVE